LDKVSVVKVGGATLGKHDTAIEDAVCLQRQGKPIIITHGGGNLITEWLNRQQIPTRFIHGERVTDKVSLEVVISVLAGLVNKELVAAINGLGGRAVGLCGADGALIQARVKNAELGYVGEVVKVNTELLKVLFNAGYIPVVAPISISVTEGSKLLNINADLVAGEIAAAIGAENLIFLTDVPGIRHQTGDIIPRLSPEKAQILIDSGVISEGMIPKAKACIRALPNTPITCIIDGREPHALLKNMKGEARGTTIG
jgi:acetylglutamate kinase